VRLRDTGQGIPLIKLPGLAGGTGLYREEVEAAARAGFRVVCVDCAGDRADDPAPGALTWDFLAAEVLGAMDALALDRALLWGTSFGCLVALASAARAPGRVSGLLLCHPPDPRQRPAYQRALLEWTEARRRPDFAARRLFTWGFRALSSWEVLFPTTIRRLPALVRAAADADTPGSTIREKIRMMTHQDPGFPSWEPAMPVSIVAGTWDTVTPLAEARRLAARLPGSTLRVLSFSGHCGAYSRPRSYHRICVEELRRLSR
jgi:pimeloyl-ACP methyl ester carboxylesterase